MISADLGRSLLAAAILMGLPGYAIATLLVPRWAWWERLVMVPGLTTGLVGIVALVTHDLGIPFGALAVLSVLGAVIVAAIALHLRAAPSRARFTVRDQLPAGVALAAGLITVGVFVYVLRGEALPIWNDLSTHAAVTQAILGTHDALPLIRTPIDHSGYVRPHMAIEATAAVTAAITRLPPDMVLTAMALLSAALLPLGLLQLSREATGSPALGALAAVLGVGMLLPVDPLIFGNYTLLVDETLVPALIVASLQALRGDEAMRAICVIVVATAAVWVGHGLELLTAAAIGSGLVLPMAVRLWRTEPKQAGLRLVAIAGSVVAAALIVTVLTRTPSVPPVTPPPGALLSIRDAILTPRPAAVSGLDRLLPALLVVMPSVALFPFFVVGVAWAVARRSALRGLVVVSLLIVLAFFDVSTRLYLRPVWKAVFPWAAGDRLMGIEYWVVPLVIAAGVAWGLALARRLRARDGLIWLPLSAALLALIVGVALAGCGLSVRYEWNLVSISRSTPGRATAADVAVLHQMAGMLPRGAIVLTNEADDAGVWVDEVTPQVSFMRREYAIQYPDEAHVVAVAHACIDPAGAMAALADVDALFVGSRPVDGVRHPWDLSCISRLPDLRIVATANSNGAIAAAFRVIH